MASEWLDHWEHIRQGTLATLDLFDEAELGFAPVPAGYSVREIALHIAHEEMIEILYGLARLLPDLPAPFRAGDFRSKKSIVDQLAGVHAQSLHYLRRLDPASLEAEVDLAWGERLRPIAVIQHIVEHETHHRGELSLAVGLLGRRGFDA